MSSPQTGSTRGLKSWHSIVRLPEFDAPPKRTALIVIDLTLQQASRHHGVCRLIAQNGLADDLGYFLDRIEQTVVPNVRRLLDAFHAHRAPVVFTRCVSLRGDGSDQTWRHRAFGLVCGIDSEDAQILPELTPVAGDIVLNKTGSSLFNSTNAEHLFRNMGIDTLVMTGIFTNSCVEGATRDAGDRDFRVLLAEDACAAMSAVGHQNALGYLDANFCHVRSSGQVLAMLAAHEAQGGARAHTPR
jgi:ureidoacrylate peracid hydrolase